MNQTFDKYRNLIGEELQKQVGQIPPALSSYLCYHFGWNSSNSKYSKYSSGKMLRPLLCLLSCEACGGGISQALPAACSLELIHNFSLIHDDIEDNSAERHHRPSLWKAFGIPQAINAGDIMFALGYRALIHPDSIRNFPPEKLLEALKVINQSCLQLCEGQHLDLISISREELDISEYFYMISRKTAALFEASAYLGALFGGASKIIVSAFKDFGLKLGIAFQVQDDVLGIWGEEKTIGKPVSNDILEKKKTLPVIFAMKQEKDRGLKRLKEIYKANAITVEQVPLVENILDEYKAREYSLAQVTILYEEALVKLKSTGLPTSSLEGLKKLAELCVGKKEKD